MIDVSGYLAFAVPSSGPIKALSWRRGPFPSGDHRTCQRRPARRQHTIFRQAIEKPAFGRTDFPILKGSITLLGSARAYRHGTDLRQGMSGTQLPIQASSKA